jgi:hypothetical protein
MAKAPEPHPMGGPSGPHMFVAMLALMVGVLLLIYAMTSRG